MKAKRDKRMKQIIRLLIVMWMVSPGSLSQELNIQPPADDTRVLQDDADGWESLFDGETLTGWESVRYGGEGKPHIKNGAIVLPAAVEGLMTGVRWTGHSLPVNNYIISYEARRVEGDDIFAGLTFPYGDTFASLVIGGWRGIVNGLSSIGGFDASENETCQLFSVRNNQWYTIQLHVTDSHIRAYLGTMEIFDLATAGKEIHLRDQILATGLTLWTYLSTGEIRNIRIKSIKS